MPRIEAAVRRATWVGSRLAVTLAVWMQAHAAVAGIDFRGGNLVDIAPKPDYLLAGDLTGDGLTDVVVVSSTKNEVDVFVASPGSAAHLALTQVLRFGDGLRGPVLGDLDADGRLDLAVADAARPAVWVLLGKGDGSFLDPYALSVAVPRDMSAMAIGNFDAVGNPDLAIVDARVGDVFTLRNDNATPPCFVTGGDFDAGEAPSQISTADFNGDGMLDLATLNFGETRIKTVSVALWKRVRNGIPEFQRSEHSVGEQPVSMLIADVNNDRRPDVVALNGLVGADAGEIDVLLNQGAGDFSPPITTTVGCPLFTGGLPCQLLTLAAGDFDGNGRVDLAVGFSDPRRGSGLNPFDAMQVLSGAGDGRFVHGPVFAIERTPVAMVSGTISGDAQVDLVVASQGVPSLQAFVNTSRPGQSPNGASCLVGDECLSSHCIDERCCAT